MSYSFVDVKTYSKDMQELHRRLVTRFDAVSGSQFDWSKRYNVPYTFLGMHSDGCLIYYDQAPDGTYYIYSFFADTERWGSYAASLDTSIIWSFLLVGNYLVASSASELTVVTLTRQGGVIHTIRGRHQFVLGGYVAAAGWRRSRLDTHGLQWFDSIPELCLCFDYDYKYGTDWGLFAGERTIPRLTMSTGCSNKCTFCTIPNTVTQLDYKSIQVQIEALKHLRFKLVYLDDKTFGQADNANELKYIYNDIKAFNPAFRGFIVQTTAYEIVYHWHTDFWGDNHVRAVEIGVETFNSLLLAKYRKPATVSTIQCAVELLHCAGLDVIVNLILGLPGETAETYMNTFEFLVRNYNKLYGVNVNTLALYEDCDLFDEHGEIGKVPQTDKGQGDNGGRSFWTTQEREDYRKFSECIYAAATAIHRR